MSERVVIDGENAILGRLASFSAKQALLGNEVVILNSDKVLMSGNKKSISDKYLQRRRRKGVIFPSQPERILKRTIRGMLSYKQGRGAAALKKIICYIGVPEKFKDEKKIKIKSRTEGAVSLRELGGMLK
jgi:large subunit ribosomal protein L13